MNAHQTDTSHHHAPNTIIRSPISETIENDTQQNVHHVEHDDDNKRGETNSHNNNNNNNNNNNINKDDSSDNIHRDSKKERESITQHKQQDQHRAREGEQRDEFVRQFMSVVDCKDVYRAEKFYVDSGGDVELALNLFLGAGDATASSPARTSRRSAKSASAMIFGNAGEHTPPRTRRQRKTQNGQHVQEGGISKLKRSLFEDNEEGSIADDSKEQPSSRVNGKRSVKNDTTSIIETSKIKNRSHNVHKAMEKTNVVPKRSGEGNAKKRRLLSARSLSDAKRVRKPLPLPRLRIDTSSNSNSPRTSRQTKFSMSIAVPEMESLLKQWVPLHSSEQKRRFYRFWIRSILRNPHKRAQVLYKPLLLNDKPIDLHELFLHVQSLGGYQVIKGSTSDWDTIRERMKQMNEVNIRLANVYRVLLADFEEHVHKTPDLHFLLQTNVASSNSTTTPSGGSRNDRISGPTPSSSSSSSSSSHSRHIKEDDEKSIVDQESKAAEIFSSSSLHDWIPTFAKEHEKRFYSDWFEYVMNSKDWQFLKNPVQLGKEALDLYTLYFNVTSRGGFESIEKDPRQWREVLQELGNVTDETTSSKWIRDHYRMLLLPYESFNNELVTPTRPNGTDAWEFDPPAPLSLSPPIRKRQPSAGDAVPQNVKSRQTNSKDIPFRARVLQSARKNNELVEPDKAHSTTKQDSTHGPSPELPLLATMMPEALPFRKRALGNVLASDKRQV